MAKKFVALLLPIIALLLLSSFAHASDVYVLQTGELSINSWHFHYSRHTFSVTDPGFATLRVTKVTPDNDISRGFLFFNRRAIPLKRFFRSDDPVFERKIKLREFNRLNVFLWGTPDAKITIDIRLHDAPEPPPTISFEANPLTITLGQSSVLTWETTNAESVSIDNGIGDVAVSGTVEVVPVEATTYILTATGPGGTTTAQVTVTVNPLPPTVTLVANPDTIVVGDSAVLNWSSEWATSCVIEPDIGVVALTGSMAVTPSQTTTYKIIATGDGGESSAEVTVTVTDPAPTVDITAADATIILGQSTTLTWSSTNADACTIEPDIGTVDPNGTVEVSPTQNTTYTITAAGSGGTTTDQVTVAVEYPVPEVTFSASPSTVLLGHTSTLSWTTAYADSVEIDPNIGAVALSGDHSVSPSTTTTYTLTATGPGGTTTVEATVTVTYPQPTVDLQIAPDTITAGESAVLSWSSANAVSVSLDNGIGTVAASDSMNVSPTATATYTITATGVDGSTVTDSVTLTVNMPAPIVTITAEPDTIIAGEASTLTWDTTYADTVTIEPEVGNVDVAGSTSVSPAATAAYSITATGPGGTTTEIISISVIAAPADVDHGVGYDEQLGGGGIVGRTVRILNGNCLDSRTDITFPSPNSKGLTFLAVYNSRSSDAGALGYGWTHNYELSLAPALDISGVTFIKIKDGSGRGVYFVQETPELYKGAFHEPSYVREVSGNFVWHRPDGSSYIFSAEGRLDAIEDEKGNRLEVSYDVQGRIADVNDQSSGRMLTFTYNSQNLLESITGPITTAVPSGIWASYQYDTEQNLTSVTYADGSGLEYGYTDTHDTHNLTEKRNLSGHLISTWSYDSSDRCVDNFSPHGKGVTIEYTEPNQVDVTDAYSALRSYTLANIAGRKRVTAMLGAAGAPYNDSNIVRWAYDSRMNLVEIEQGNGTVHRFLSHDSRGNPGTVVLADSTSQQRTISLTYHPDMRTVLTRTEASVLGTGVKETVYDYDDDDNAVSNQSPTKLIHRIIEKGYTSDAAGDIVPYQYVTSISYNSFGQVVDVDGPIDGPADIASFSYDPVTGDRLSVTKPLIGATVHAGYDAAGRYGSITDVNNQTTTFTYDGRGRVVETTYSDNSSTFTSYNTAGTIASTTDADGITQDYLYGEDYGRLLRVTDAQGNYMEYAYDLQGDRIEQVNFDATDTPSTRKQWSYQGPVIAGRLYREINPDNTYTQYDYDANGNLVKVTDPKGNATSYAFDPLNRITSVTQPGNITTVYAYDSHGNLTSVTDVNTNQTTYQFDDMGRLVSTVSPDAGSTSFYYDSAGNLLGKTDANAVAVSYSYDALNRPTAIDYPDTTQNVTFSYDQGTFGMGRRTGMNDPSGTSQFLYDHRGRLVGKVSDYNGHQFSVEQTYTRGGRISSITYPSGRTVDYARNACVCRIDSVSTTYNGMTRMLVQNLSYRPFAGPKGLDNGGGGTVNNAYDEFGRVIAANPGAPMERTYGYDANGNLESISAVNPTRYNQSFTYDALNRLTGATGGIYGDITYTYDDVGNRLTRAINGQMETYTYTPGTNKIEQIAGNVTTTFSYDANGNTTGIGNRTFFYNQNNRLVRVEEGGSIIGDYTYNGLGQRVVKVAGGQTTTFHYDLKDNLIAESDGNFNFKAEYIYRGKGLLAKVDVDHDRLLFYHNSYLGTPQALADDTDTIVWEGLYKPFGDTFVNPYSTAENNLRFAGQYYDAETGLHYNYHRYYDPSLGRYLRADPIGLQGGVNLYSYVKNNPNNSIDPEGLELSKWNTTPYDIDYGGPGAWAPPPSVIQGRLTDNAGVTFSLNNFEVFTDKKGCSYLCWSITTDLIGFGGQKGIYTPTKGSSLSFYVGIGKYLGGTIDLGGMYENEQWHAPNIYGGIGLSFGLPVGGFNWRLKCSKLKDVGDDGCPCGESPSISSF